MAYEMLKFRISQPTMLMVEETSSKYYCTAFLLLSCWTAGKLQEAESLGTMDLQKLLHFVHEFW